MRQNPEDVAWVVVEVHSGIPADVEAYEDQEEAWRRVAELRDEIREERDAVDAFQVPVRRRAPDRLSM